MFARSGREPGVPVVVHADGDLVFPVHDLVGDIDLESRIAALMMSGELAVHIHVRDLEDPGGTEYPDSRSLHRE